MKVYIYTLPNCKACTNRTSYHESIAQHLAQDGIECILVEFGQIDGKTYLPYEEHDSLCRKPSNPSVYSTPVYIADTGNSAAKLADPSKYGDSHGYVGYIKDVVTKISS